MLQPRVEQGYLKETDSLKLRRDLDYTNGNPVATINNCESIAASIATISISSSFRKLGSSFLTYSIPLLSKMLTPILPVLTGIQASIQLDTLN